MKLPWYMRQKLPVALVAGLGGLFTVVDVACAQPWATTTAPNNVPWKALASSADGTILVAAGAAGSYSCTPPAPIYASTNAGATWIQTSAPSNNWASVACSADGVKLVAVAMADLGCHFGGDGLIYTSPDLGRTWTRTSAPSNNWSSVASSADGAKLVAVATTYPDYRGDSLIYTSSNSGASWTRTSAPSNTWSSVASSADGAKLVAVSAPQWYSNRTNSGYLGDGAIYSSLDSGATWTRTSAPSNGWSAVAASADGTRLVAVAVTYWDWYGKYVGDGAIYRSLDSSATWSRTSAPSNTWTAVASSADGTKLVAAASQMICTSSDSGATWTPTDTPRGYWTAVASSADGYRVVADVTGGNPPDLLAVTLICTMPYSGPWRLADAPASGWVSVASSADGTKLVAVAAPYWDSYGKKYVSDGAIYDSLDSGATWRRTSAPSNSWHLVASSADGTRLVAVTDRIYTSSNSGTTWTQTTAPSNTWTSVASSADGTKLIAGTHLDTGGNGLIYTSSNSGATWTPTTAPSNQWSSVASSADGARLVAVAAVHWVWAGNRDNYVGDGGIYSSLDSGATWRRTSAPSNSWSAVTSSADGTMLVATSTYGGSELIYASTNSGATWTATGAPRWGWTAVASSADGTKLMAVSSSSGFFDNSGAYIYISTNSGATWTSAGAPAVSSWKAVASSADGSNIVALGDQVICTLRSPAPVPPQPPSPQLAVGLSGATLGLSWLVPSTRFVLQQNSDLGSRNWADVPTPPTLDYTNLHHRLTLTPSSGSSYFRLKQQ